MPTWTATELMAATVARVRDRPLLSYVEPAPEATANQWHGAQWHGAQWEQWHGAQWEHVHGHSWSSHSRGTRGGRSRSPLVQPQSAAATRAAAAAAVIATAAAALELPPQPMPHLPPSSSSAAAQLTLVNAFASVICGETLPPGWRRMVSRRDSRVVYNNNPSLGVCQIERP